MLLRHGGLVAAIIIFLVPFHSSSFAAGPNDVLDAAARALQAGDKEQALKLADQAVAADAKNASAYVLRSQIHQARHEYDAAIDDDNRLLALAPESAAAFQRRGEDQFRAGHFKESVADFDKVIELNPARGPYHWQRGISLYYAGEFARGAKQFELHKTVNPEDVENAVWDFLCVARLSAIEKAREGLIAIHGDSRVPMMQIYALFSGKGTEQDVMDAANAGKPGEAELKERLFYAHLYLGLFDEASGRADSAKQHIRLAAEKYAGDDYMGDVARVHLAHADAAVKAGK